MSQKKTKREVLQEIADDMAADAKNFDGQPFNGRTVAEYFGHQGAAIAAIAVIVRAMLDDAEPSKPADEPSAGYAFLNGEPR